MLVEASRPLCLQAESERESPVTRPAAKKISIVTPCYNEEAGIAECVVAVRSVLETELPGFVYEHVFIDNCSEDRTVLVLRELARHDKRIKIIVNARNFGPDRSPFHAMLECDGDVVIPVLADLQTPPALIPRMIDLWLQGKKSVIAIKRKTEEPALLGLARRAFYDAMRRASKVEQIPNYMGYGLYDRCVIEALRNLNEPEPYFRGLIAEVGFERGFVEYDQPRRRHGRSSYTIFSLADLRAAGPVELFARAAPPHDAGRLLRLLPQLPLRPGLSYRQAGLLVQPASRRRARPDRDLLSQLRPAPRAGDRRRIYRFCF